MVTTKRLFLVFSFFFLAVSAFSENLTLPLDQRPTWLQDEGIIMAGSWEPLLFRVRRDGSEGYTPTPEQQAAYLREHSPEMVAKLKSLGVNFVMMHGYKGFGLEHERESMADAVQFSKLCHHAGLHVGVYNYSGAFGWELLFQEIPEAQDWVVLDENKNPVTYGEATYRYYWNRNHPRAQEFYKKIIRFAIEEIGTDLIHFDNYVIGPGMDSYSVERFREYLKRNFSPTQLKEMGIDDVNIVLPPMQAKSQNMLRAAWLKFTTDSLTESYWDMSKYARSLRKDILVECNPGGVPDSIDPPVDHSTLLQGGEAFWDEGRHPGLRDGKLITRIRTYKFGRRMNNIAFAYTTNPLEAAESMAFNLDCLGCICWFEYNKIVSMPGSDIPVTLELSPYIQFFKNRRDLLRHAEVVADVAVLRSFPSQVFADPANARLTGTVEQKLIENRIPFQIIGENLLGELNRYRGLVLAGCVALSDPEIAAINNYRESGGKLCIIGPVASYDEWMHPRQSSPLSGINNPNVRYVTDVDEGVKAITELCGDELSMSIDGPLGLCAEITEQETRRLIHLVNYLPEQPINNVTVRVKVPAGRRVGKVMTGNPLREKDLALEYREQNNIVEFTVPSVYIYEIAQVVWR